MHDNLNEDDDAALDDFLAAQGRVDVKPLIGNPMDVTVTVTGRGNDLKRTYRSGNDRIKVVGDPYTVFDDKRQ